MSLQGDCSAALLSACMDTEICPGRVRYTTPVTASSVLSGQTDRNGRQYFVLRPEIPCTSHVSISPSDVICPVRVFGEYCRLRLGVMESIHIGVCRAGHRCREANGKCTNSAVGASQRPVLHSKEDVDNLLITYVIILTRW